MDLGNYKSKNGGSIFVIAALSYILSCELLVNGSSATMKDVELSKHEGTVETMETENGDVVDCVDIYKQPAFNHPLLRNHSIQMKPSSFPKSSVIDDSRHNSTPNWLNIVYCPEGTVPIFRTKISEQHWPMPYTTKKKQNNASVEYAQVRMSSGIYMGAEAWINIWNPITADGFYSSAMVMLVSGETLPDKNVMQAGWMVLTPDRETRLFISWTKDGYQKTGCLNLQCPGFVQTNQASFIGAAAHPVSQYQGAQVEVKITIFKDMVTGNWWLEMQNHLIGYWPGSIFTGLSKSSQFVYWGGEVSTDDYLTMTTEMGSGHFPSEGWGKAGYFRSLGYVDNAGFKQDANGLISHVVNPSWYNVIVPTWRMKYYGTYFYFGGPGHRLSKQNNVTE